MSLHLYRSLLSVIGILQFLTQKFCICFIIFKVKYFILISLFTCFLLAYRNTINFLLLILFWEFPCIFLGISKSTFMPYENRDCFFFLFDLYVFYFLVLLYWANQNFESYLNSCDESRCPRLLPDLKKKAFSLSPSSMTFAVGFYGCSLSWERSSFLFLVFWFFYCEEGRNFLYASQFQAPNSTKTETPLFSTSLYISLHLAIDSQP